MANNVLVVKFEHFIVLCYVLLSNMWLFSYLSLTITDCDVTNEYVDLMACVIGDYYNVWQNVVSFFGIFFFVASLVSPSPFVRQLFFSTCSAFFHSISSSCKFLESSFISFEIPFVPTSTFVYLIYFIPCVQNVRPFTFLLLASETER